MTAARPGTSAASRPHKTNESAVVELSNGDLLLNMRSYHGRNRRAIQRSHDGGLTWSPLEFDETLIEPVCQASLISLGRGRLAFSNPAATTRTRMTLRLSKDDGATWTTSRRVRRSLRLLLAGPPPQRLPRPPLRARHKKPLRGHRVHPIPRLIPCLAVNPAGDGKSLSLR